MSYLPQFPFARRSVCLFLLFLMACVNAPILAHAGGRGADPAAKSPDTQTATQPAKPQEPSSNENAELSSRDTAPTFRVRVNLVLVRVVVRDEQGHVVPNLRKEDFQLFDNRKPQTISTFSVDTPASHVIAATTSAEPCAAPVPAEAAAVASQRFVSVLFDDQHLGMSDALFVRNAATRFWGAGAFGSGRHIYDFGAVHAGVYR